MSLSKGIIPTLDSKLGEIFMKEMSSAKMKPRPSKDIERSMRWLDKKINKKNN